MVELTPQVIQAVSILLLAQFLVLWASIEYKNDRWF